MKDREKDIAIAVQEIAEWAYSDSLVVVDRAILQDVLAADWEIAGRTLTEEECKVFVIGEDNGSIPEELEDLFPQTHEFLNSYWI